MIYDFRRNFNKYIVSGFNEISSFDSKFDTLNKFYKDFKKLKDVRSRNKERKQKKIILLKSASLRYDELIDIYEKEYDQVFESKDEDWRKKHDYKNLKDLDYQPDKKDESKQPHQWQQSNQLMLPG